MAVGDLVTQDWQMERSSLLTGDGTDYDLVQIDGLASMAAVRAQDRPLLLRHGSIPGFDYLGERIFTVSYEIVDADPSSMSVKVNALADAFNTSLEEEGLAFQLPGVADNVKAIVWGRVRRRDVPINLKFTRGVAEVTFEVHCTDPRVYSAATHLDSVAISTTGGGLTFNASPNFVFGDTTTSGTMTLANAGNIGTPVEFRINGPVTSPVIEYNGGELEMSFDITVTAGDYLLVNSEDRTVMLNGTASRYSAMEVGSTWFDLAPGNNEITFRAAAADTGTLSATWRDAWS